MQSINSIVSMAFSLTRNKNDRDFGLADGHSTGYNGTVTICVIGAVDNGFVRIETA